MSASRNSIIPWAGIAICVLGPPRVIVCDTCNKMSAQARNGHSIDEPLVFQAGKKEIERDVRVTGAPSYIYNTFCVLERFMHRFSIFSVRFPESAIKKDMIDLLVGTYRVTHPQETSARVFLQVQIVSPVILHHHFRLEFAVIWHVFRIRWSCELTKKTVNLDLKKITMVSFHWYKKYKNNIKILKNIV